MIPLPPLELNIELTGLPDYTGSDAQLKEAVMHGAMAAAEVAKGVWIRGAQAAGVRATGAYIRGIQAAVPKIVIDRSDATRPTWEIVIEITNTAPHARFIEEGHAAFHMPSRVNWGGPRVKHGKKGPYLSIPLRHRAFQSQSERQESGATQATISAMMPNSIYQQAKSLSRTIAKRQGPIHSSHGQFQQADRYHWGGRLDRSGVPAGTPERRKGTVVGHDKRGNPLVNPAWKSSKFHGLFKSGPAGHSQYMTIRTMTPRSQGWNIPAVAGKHVAAKVSQVLRSGDRIQRAMDIGLAAFTERDRSTR